MKSILISIKPKYVADILNGRKTIEIRKNMPKCELPITVYIYCTKGNKNRYNRELLRKYDGVYLIDKIDYKTFNQPLNGKVVAKFTLNKVEEIYCGKHGYCEDEISGLKGHIIEYSTKTMAMPTIIEKSCIVYNDDLYDYLGSKEGICGYAWHISNLVIFDKPKKLSEFYTCTRFGIPQYEVIKGNFEYRRLSKAPQSWCYVEVEHEKED